MEMNGHVELDLSTNAKKSNLQGALGVGTSNLAAKPYLPSLRARVDKIDKDKLKTTPADLSKPSNILENDVDKKTVHDNWLLGLIQLILVGLF